MNLQNLIRAESLSPCKKYIPDCNYSHMTLVLRTPRYNGHLDTERTVAKSPAKTNYVPSGV